MHEAVAVLKGVLGFEDQPLTTPPKLRRVVVPAGRSEDQDQDSRRRAGSDPFTDKRTPGELTPPVAPTPRKASGRGPAPPPPPSRRKVSPTPQPLSDQAEPRWRDGGMPVSPILLSPGLESPVPSPDIDASLGRVRSEDRELLLPGRQTRSPLALSPMAASDGDSIDSRSVDLDTEEADLNRPRFRLWTFPAHIADDEADALVSLFPRFVGRERAGKSIDPRLKPQTTPAPRDKDLELGLCSGTTADVWSTISVDGVEVRIPRPEREDEAGVLRCGTGRMWAGGDDRRAGWEGGTWFRFKRWWRRLFGLA